jgi:hypothetical protein
MLNRSVKLWQAIVLTTVVVLLAVLTGVAAGGQTVRITAGGRSFSVPAHETVTHHFLCDRGIQAFGGGVRLDDPAVEAVKGTYWFDDEDNNRDGWAAVVQNNSDHTQHATVFLTCG